MRNEISKAMDAHTLWRDKLLNIISTGSSDIHPDIIKTDNNCAFGKWFYSAEIPNEMKNSEIYKQIQDLHAKFHLEAGRIADLAISGDTKEAAHQLESGDVYNDISKKLIQLLIKWRREVPE